MGNSHKNSSTVIQDELLNESSKKSLVNSLTKQDNLRCYGRRELIVIIGELKEMVSSITMMDKFNNFEKEITLFPARKAVEVVIHIGANSEVDSATIIKNIKTCLDKWEEELGNPGAVILVTLPIQFGDYVTVSEGTLSRGPIKGKTWCVSMKKYQDNGIKIPMKIKYRSTS